MLMYILMQERQVDHLRRLKDKVKTPDSVPRLFDLVTVKDEKLKLAFFASLGNTVVAEDLNQVLFLLSSSSIFSLSESFAWINLLWSDFPSKLYYFTTL